MNETMAELPGRHRCVLNTAWSAYGPAVDVCIEDAEGHLWVTTNGEYASQVDFCPVCGCKAPTPAVRGQVEYAHNAVSSKAPGVVDDVQPLLGIEDWYDV